MKKYLLCIIYCSSIGAAPRTTEQVLNSLYSFHNMATESILEYAEEELIARFGDHEYGEITYDGVKKLLNELKFTQDDVFFDLGSGFGKMVIQVYLDSPVQKSAGVELSSTRFRVALDAKYAMRAEGLLVPGRQLVFYHQNILEMSISDATVLYINLFNFSEAFTKKLVKKIVKLAKGTRILTSRIMPIDSRLVLQKTIMVPMSWGFNAPIYLYKLEK